MTPGYGIIPRDPIDGGALAEITDADAKVFLAICAHVRGKDWTAHPGDEKLARLTGLTTRCVREARKRLNRAGFLDAEPGCGRGNATGYHLRGNAERPFLFSTLGRGNADARKAEAPRPQRRNPGARAPLTTEALTTFEQRTASGKPTPDPRVKVFIDFFAKTYSETLGRPYIVTGGKDGATTKRLLKVLDGAEVCALAALKKAARNMLSDSWAREKASIGLLSSQLNNWRGNGTGRRGANFHPAPGADVEAYSKIGKRF